MENFGCKYLLLVLVTCLIYLNEVNRKAVIDPAPLSSLLKLVWQG
jgi:hypothetical protein